VGTAIVWFRGLLRLHDNPVLSWASSSDEVDSVIPVYIIDERDRLGGKGGLGDNRLRFLYDSLTDLDRSFRKRYGTGILVFSGDPRAIIQSLIEDLGSEASWLLTDYRSEPSSRQDIEDIEGLLKGTSVTTTVFPAVSTILDLESVVGTASFTNPRSSKDIDGILREHLDEGPDGYLVGESLPVPDKVVIDPGILEGLAKGLGTSDQLVPLTEIARMSAEIGGLHYFPGGESMALERLSRKVTGRPDYVNGFSKPDTISTNEDGDPMEPTTTGLSPYLSTGCLSVRMVWNEVARASFNSEHTKPPRSLHGQLMFREMFYLLSRSVENWDKDEGNSNCKSIAWGDLDEELIDAWESGMTGFPYIDAMMRQLDATGWMHHLGRHAVSCFFTRGQLWQNWRYGRDVFERKLVDSDWALNNGNWLWLAGVAPFSMPYYRVYNPCPDSKSSLNVETEEASFVRHWVPELASFPSKYIFEPSLAPKWVQEESGCVIGTDYPLPIVDRKESRKRNLALFKESL